MYFFVSCCTAELFLNTRPHALIDLLISNREEILEEPILPRSEPEPEVLSRQLEDVNAILTKNEKWKSELLAEKQTLQDQISDMKKSQDGTSQNGILELKNRCQQLQDEVIEKKQRAAQLRQECLLLGEEIMKKRKELKLTVSHENFGDMIKLTEKIAQLQKQKEQCLLEEQQLVKEKEAMLRKLEELECQKKTPEQAKLIRLMEELDGLRKSAREHLIHLDELAARFSEEEQDTTNGYPMDPVQLQKIIRDERKLLEVLEKKNQALEAKLKNLQGNSLSSRVTLVLYLLVLGVGLYNALKEVLKF